MKRYLALSGKSWGVYVKEVRNELGDSRIIWSEDGNIYEVTPELPLPEPQPKPTPEPERSPSSETMDRLVEMRQGLRDTYREMNPDWRNEVLTEALIIGRQAIKDRADKEGRPELYEEFMSSGIESQLNTLDTLMQDSPEFQEGYRTKEDEIKRKEMDRRKIQTKPKPPITPEGKMDIA